MARLAALAGLAALAALPPLASGFRRVALATLGPNPSESGCGVALAALAWADLTAAAAAERGVQV